MNTKINNISQEKKDNIIKATIEEFGNRNYDNASTDIIAQQAKIAKGSLFYYFGSKKNLYLYIVEYCVDLFTEEVLKRAEEIKSEDFYERVKKISIIKQRIMIEYPLHSKIIIDAFINMPVKLKGDLENLYLKYYSENMIFLEEYLIKYMNVELLRPSIKKEDVVFVTLTVLDSLSKKYMKTYQNKSEEFIYKNEDLLEEFDKYIDIIKYGLYK